MAFDLTPGSEFEHLDEELAARWTGDAGYDGDGYRALTKWFNKRLLKQVYDAHGRDTFGTRLESDFAALQGGDELLREEVLDDVRQDGIDADTVVDAMVSWSTMRHHLQGCLEAEKPTPDRSSEWERDSVAIATHQAEEKLADAVQSLVGKRRLTGGEDAELRVEAYLECSECGIRRRFTDALDRGRVCERHPVQEVDMDLPTGGETSGRSPSDGNGTDL